MKILFICKYNRFRSQVADAYFKKINKNKNIKSDSAGIISGIPIAKSVKDIAKKFGFRVKGKPKGVNEKLLKSADLIIIVANDVPESLFGTKNKKLVRWNIPDVCQADLCEIERVVKIIIKKVDELNNRLKNRK